MSQTTSGAFPRSISNTAALLVGNSQNAILPVLPGAGRRGCALRGRAPGLPGRCAPKHRCLGLPPPPAQPTYLATVLADSPRALWRLSEATGTVAANSIAGGASGAYQNGVLLGQAGVLANDTNKSVYLDGTNDQVNMGDPATGSLDFGTGDFSVETWVRPWANDDRVIVSKRGASGPYWQVLIDEHGAEKGEVRADVFDGVVSRAQRARTSESTTAPGTMWSSSTTGILGSRYRLTESAGRPRAPSRGTSTTPARCSSASLRPPRSRTSSGCSTRSRSTRACCRQRA